MNHFGYRYDPSQFKFSKGIVGLALKFRHALNDTVTVIVSEEFENVIEIDHNRNVVFDFGLKR